MELDRANLTAEEAQLIDAWEALFASTGWQLIKRRFEPRVSATQADALNAPDLRALGHAQGRYQMLFELVNLEETLENEIGQHIAVAQAERLESVDENWRG